jgi:hypothetical protein
VSYEIQLSESAAGSLATLPLDLRLYVLAHLVQLSSSPLEFARQVVSPPFPRGGMMYEFHQRFEDELHPFTVLFHYAEDEATLLVDHIGHTEMS